MYRKPLLLLLALLSASSTFASPPSDEAAKAKKDRNFRQELNFRRAATLHDDGTNRQAEDANDPRKASGAASGVGDGATGVGDPSKPWIPKFRWSQNRRSVTLTIMAKRLGVEDETLEVSDAGTLVYRAEGETSRAMASSSFTEGGANGVRQAVVRTHAFELVLKLLRGIVANKTVRFSEEGYRVIRLRKASPGKDWTSLVDKEWLKERPVVKTKMQWDGRRSRLGRSASAAHESDELVLTLRQSAVEREHGLRRNELGFADALKRGGLLFVQFCPSWEEDAQSWADEYGKVAEDLEDEVIVARVSAKTDHGLVASQGAGLPSKDTAGRRWQPVYRTFVDGVPLAVEDCYSGSNSAEDVSAHLRKLLLPTVEQPSDMADWVTHADKQSSSVVAIGMDEPELAALRAAVRGLRVSDLTVTTAAASIELTDSAALGHLSGSEAPIAAGGMLSSASIEVPGLLLRRSGASRWVASAENAQLSDAGWLEPLLASWSLRSADLDSYSDSKEERALEHVGVMAVHLFNGPPSVGSNTALAAVKTALLDDSELRSMIYVFTHTASDPDTARRATAYGLDGMTWPAVAAKYGNASYPGAAVEQLFKTAKAGAALTAALSTLEAASDAIAFAKAVAAGAAPVGVRSEPKADGAVPRPGEVGKAVGLGLESLFENSGAKADVLLELFDGTAEDEDWLEEKMKTVAGKLRHVETVLWGRMDVSRNDLPKPLLAAIGGEVPQLPAMFMFPAGDGTEAIPCTGKCRRSLKGMGGFVKRSAKIPFTVRAPPCFSSPCQNSAKCSQSGQGRSASFECACAEGWQGDTCGEQIEQDAANDEPEKCLAIVAENEAVCALLSGSEECINDDRCSWEAPDALDGGDDKENEEL